LTHAQGNGEMEPFNYVTTGFVSHRFPGLASAICLLVNYVNQLTALTSQWQTCARDKKRSCSGNTFKPAFPERSGFAANLAKWTEASQ